MKHTSSHSRAAIAATAAALALPGEFTIDNVAAGGPKVDVEFDVRLLRELKAAR
jgi:hypothetical protein